MNSSNSYNRQWQLVIDFWFEEIEPKQWFVKSDEFDKKLSQKFLSIYKAASLGELFLWRETPLGRLAEIIVLDQFSRNIFRDKPQAFALDALAVILSQEAISLGVDKVFTLKQKPFLYMPLMHSESLLIHQMAEPFFAQKGLENTYQFELRHREIIEKFGRYPHRNKILGRISSAEEIAFLNEPGSSF